jgi:PD-(D/E)XK nuclease superfamily
LVLWASWSIGIGWRNADMTKDNQLQMLENFIFRNPDLDNLENMLNDFNVFETLKLVHAEIRHSNVLAWLLNPAENHGLSNYFLRQFLKNIVSSNKTHFESLSLSVFDFESFEYASVETRREWRNIDLLVILSEDNHRIVLTIENKIKSTEHSNQLSRYRGIVDEEYPDGSKIYVLLSPDNLIPSDENWIPFNYSTIADILSDILRYRKDSISSNVYSFLAQYESILRRYIVGNSEIEKIAVDIYTKHKEALDIIFQYKPDIYSDISRMLQEKLTQDTDIILDSAGKTVIRFTTKTMDKLFEQVGEGWTKSGRIVLFEIALSENRVALRLYIGPGESGYRESLRTMFMKNKELFRLAGRKIGTKWHAVDQFNLAGKRDFDEYEHEEILEVISAAYDKFIDNDIKLMQGHCVANWNADS